MNKSASELIALADDPQVVAVAQQAIMKHPFFVGSATLAFGLARTALIAAAKRAGVDALLPARPFAFAVRRAPENGVEQWRLFMDESEARAEAEQLDGDYEALFRVGDRRSAVAALTVEAQIASAVRVWLECPTEKRPSAQALGIRVAEIASFDREDKIGVAETPFYGAKCPSYPNCTGGCGLGCTHEIENREPRMPPEWLWWGEVDGKDIVTFGRWPKRGAQWRYKLAEIQPTEHDNNCQTEKYKAAWDAYVEASMCPGVKTFDCIKRAVDAALHSPKIAAAETSPGDVLAMKEACKRIVVSFRHQVLPADRAMLRKIEAAIDRLDVKAEAKSQEPDAVAVKPLEWSDHEGDGVQVADAVTGEYRVRCHGGEFWVVARDGIPLSSRPYELASFAKAAAQADYEQRIRSALIHLESPAVSVDAIFARLNLIAPAVENLACNQEQADMDGCMVKVSRQALDETLEAVNAIATLIAGGR